MSNIESVKRHTIYDFRNTTYDIRHTTYAPLMPSLKHLSIFVEELWQWFDRHKRTLPWRDLKVKNADQRAYLVLVSEIMLQQTQVSRVTILYKKFIQQFPHIEALAEASNADVLQAWRGLGYNSRALRLRDAARRVIVDYAGTFPRTKGELKQLPGVGDYTAGALMNFAFHIPIPCIDTNIRRILHRFFVGPEKSDGTFRAADAFLEKILLQLMQLALKDPTRSSADFFAALMDFGSMVLTKSRPKWEQFSPRMKSICKAYGRDFKRTKKLFTKEPGRIIAGKFVPRRISRGKILELLRDQPRGLPINVIGQHVALDWNPQEHFLWLEKILKQLTKDNLINKRRTIYSLS